MPYNPSNNQTQDHLSCQHRNHQHRVVSQESYTREQPEYFAAHSYNLNYKKNNRTEQQSSSAQYQDEVDEEYEQHSSNSSFVGRVEQALESLARRVSGESAYGSNTRW